MKTVQIITLGCKVNQFESAAFQTAFENHGLKMVGTRKAADIVIVNTCAVTGAAGAQSRQAIRRALTKNPNAKLLITGCYAELASKELIKFPELQGREYQLIGNAHKDRLVEAALGLGLQALERNQLLPGDILEARTVCHLPVRRFGERTRAYLRIQDGCDSYCTYCIVPYTRGPSRSLPVEKVLEQAKIFEEEGHKEIVLTGIHLGYFGEDLAEKTNLTDLLDQLSRTTPGIAYRISSLEPTEINLELLQLMRARTNIQPHLHIPLQSGHDEILARMNRRYTTAQFRQVIANCKTMLPDIAIGIDILVGFPGETELHFAAAREFLASLDFTYLHVFPYSSRPGTAAADFAGQVPKNIKEQRVAELRGLSDRKKQHFLSSQLGKTKNVLVEGKRDGATGLLKGVSGNYVPVIFAGPDMLCDNVASVKLVELHDSTVLGEWEKP
jgi:threonylcarbamoyladenosine tRNA methylthiotransferase MtaB